MAKIVEFKYIPIDQIVTRNGRGSVRQGDWAADESFTELVRSIELYGQIDPIGVVRYHNSTKVQYDIIYGWRRYAALRYIEERGGLSMRVAALIYDDVDAQDGRIYQAIHSQTTAPHTAPDLALNLRILSDIMDPIISDQRLAETVGLQPEYAHKLLRIMRNGSKQLIQRWTTDPDPLSVVTVSEIAMGEADKQTYHYELAHDLEYHTRDGSPSEVARRGIDEVLALLDEVKQNFTELKEGLSVNTKDEESRCETEGCREGESYHGGDT